MKLGRWLSSYMQEDHSSEPQNPHTCQMSMAACLYFQPWKVQRRDLLRKMAGTTTSISNLLV